jgi:hypothetical protein
MEVCLETSFIVKELLFVVGWRPVNIAQILNKPLILNFCSEILKNNARYISIDYLMMARTPSRNM